MDLTAALGRAYDDAPEDTIEDSRVYLSALASGLIMALSWARDPSVLLWLLGTQ